MTSASNTRVVITGLGAVTPLGDNFATTWQRLIAGESAAAPVTLFDVAGCRCKQAASAQLPDLPDLTPKQLSRLSRAARLAVPAARAALADAGLLGNDGRSRLTRLTLSVSTTGGGMAWGERFLRAMLAQQNGVRQFPYIVRYQAHHQVHDLQRCLGFRGPITIIANACASGANAIGHGADLIRAGACDCLLTGGFEALTELIYVGFDCLQAMSPERCCPFDVGRNGLMLGEAAAFAVLESESHARARGVRILAELAGYGHATDLHHLTQPDPLGTPTVRAIRHALAEAGCPASEIGYLNAHGTGTLLNDTSECAAFATVFGEKEGAVSSPVRISSTKAAIGHTLGAAGSIEALFAVAALRSGQLPPNLNLRRPDPRVAANLVAVGERRADVRAVLSVNLGFGGSNAALIFKPYDGTSVDAGVAGPLRIAANQPPPQTPHFATTPRRPSLAICGMGAVLPAETPQRMRGVSAAIGEHAVFCVDKTREPLATLQNQARVRRASPITLFMLAAAQQALAAQPLLRRDRLGIVAAFNTGVVVPTRRFFEGILKNGQRFASPNVFPETVFNSATSHVAAILGVAGPCYSLVSDDAAWVGALRVAEVWLANELVESALVIGATELDPIAIDAYACGGWLPPHGRTGFVPSEGAAAVLVRRTNHEGGVRIAQLADGFTYRARREARQAARDCFAQFPSGVGVCHTAQHTWLGAIEKDTVKGTPIALPYHGEAFPASAAWNTVRAAEIARTRRDQILVPVWGLNGESSALLLAPG
ncbi:MAG TPA: beta-ketoacyl-[acyl-carrier-protein] synthase family protein [Verrucomicrobiae bacterium]|nr:beta-ketoacyl-[acyl-carrier-protein] synthase family protein [Verrucomicrobiae bacterium]